MGCTAAESLRPTVSDSSISVCCLDSDRSRSSCCLGLPAALTSAPSLASRNDESTRATPGLRRSTAAVAGMPSSRNDEAKPTLHDSRSHPCKERPPAEMALLRSGPIRSKPTDLGRRRGVVVAAGRRVAWANEGAVPTGAHAAARGGAKCAGWQRFAPTSRYRGQRFEDCLETVELERAALRWRIGVEPAAGRRDVPPHNTAKLSPHTKRIDRPKPQTTRSGMRSAKTAQSGLRLGLSSSGVRQRQARGDGKLREDRVVIGRAYGVAAAVYCLHKTHRRRVGSIGEALRAGSQARGQRR